MGSRLDRLYAAAPLAAQHAMVSAFGAMWKWRRFGPGYREELAGFIAREAYTDEQWRAYQTQALREILALAWARVPYYQRAWKHLGLDAGAIARFRLEDLAALPLLEKDAARAEPESFCPGGKPLAGAVICPTSGSTGTPVRVFVTNRELRRSLALREARGCRPAGVSYDLPRATFSGRLVEPRADSDGPFYRFNWFERQVYYSAFHLSARTARAYLAPLHRHRVVWGTGYTKAWEQLAQLAIEQGLPPPPDLRAIITTSEKVTPASRALLERAFGCRVFEEYGTVEDALFACEHADGRMRLSPDAGIVELRRLDGSIVTSSSSDEGETITTSFMKRGQLFIRYRLGDLAAWDTQPDASGLHMPIFAEIIGRTDDVVIGPDGRRVSTFYGIFKEVPGVREAQVVQKARDRLEIRVVPSVHYGDDTVVEIVARVHARFTTAMQVDVRRVESIPRTKAGKFRSVVNEMTR